ncbi:ATP-binding cassette domain-containing protein [Rhodococcus sp. BP-252]|uniref:ABC transporter ATP-binding protein n=1 Tax=unclassified Rhodococcus (in: high G+C Gram-positive bacteria) TaxID=192944 RepID=UPI001C9B546B|nr:MULTISPECIES: ATP-binding cassette domain-containing protein [unclassified Rhodococcus (in: high G+C Gram-positive bacteria)]MBY6410228.1 ATP-binding cassette domain-containing protein [Rhodococcus sp. BP-320]MBY6415197.1 ATP-binding cassette domain-containing protein [Rhodococcus sp. BP-321]MBY6421520.1 ATP-binding cassette domain-containing protein [Rhodococcus sp. BP-324]MBY6425495.1 ATP-binding cassette domain-containing protein [Rhodococcus sp. BP-323]MBY6430093.1 ATP-binding cassette 
MPRLNVSDLSVDIGDHRILNDVSLSVPEGRIVGLLGANGAGKSTAIDAITGYQRVTSGTVEVDGKDVTRTTAPARARHGLSRTFQDYLLFEDLTVEENLLSATEVRSRKSVAASIVRFGRPGAQEFARVDEVLVAHGLDDIRHKRVEELSLGWHARVNLARAVVQDPSVLLLDEPAAALSLDARRRVVDTVKNIRDTSDIAILLVEHNLDVVTEVCDDIYVLEAGSVIAHGPTSEILDHPMVRSIYLGEEEPGALPAGSGAGGVTQKRTEVTA